MQNLKIFNRKFLFIIFLCTQTVQRTLCAEVNDQYLRWAKCTVAKGGTPTESEYEQFVSSDDSTVYGRLSIPNHLKVRDKHEYEVSNPEDYPKGEEAELTEQLPRDSVPKPRDDRYQAYPKGEEAELTEQLPRDSVPKPRDDRYQAYPMLGFQTKYMLNIGRITDEYQAAVRRLEARIDWQVQSQTWTQSIDDTGENSLYLNQARRQARLLYIYQYILLRLEYRARLWQNNTILNECTEVISDTHTRLFTGLADILQSQPERQQTVSENNDLELPMMNEQHHRIEGVPLLSSFSSINLESYDSSQSRMFDCYTPYVAICACMEATSAWPSRQEVHNILDVLEYYLSSHDSGSVQSVTKYLNTVYAELQYAGSRRLPSIDEHKQHLILTLS